MSIQPLQRHPSASERLDTPATRQLIGMTRIPILGVIPAALGVSYTICRIAVRVGEISYLTIQSTWEMDPAQYTALVDRQWDSVGEAIALLFTLPYYPLRVLTLGYFP